MRKFLIAVLILLAALVAVDFGARAWAQSWLGDRLQGSLGLSEKPSVSLGGFPFLVAVASGDIPSVSVDIGTFRARGVEVSDVHVDLDHVTFPPLKLLLRQGSTIEARRGDGTVAMTGEQVTQALLDRGVPVTVTFSDGEVRVTSDRFPAREVAARAGIEGGSLVISSADPTAPGTFAVPLPSIVPGLRYESLTIEGSRAELHVVVDHPVFAVGSR